MRFPLLPPPGIVRDNTTFSSSGQWHAADKVRFWRGFAQTIGGWERATFSTATGVCRTMLTWTDANNTLSVGLGTHSSLQVLFGGDLFTITPTVLYPPFALGANPLAVVNATPTVTVTANHHGLTTGDSVTVSGAVAVGGITPNGTFTVTVVNSNSFTYTFGSNATSTASGGGSAVVITPLAPWVAGSIDGTGSAGYGTGSYSTGPYSVTSSTSYFPLTWSLANYGVSLMANPRGRTIYWWQNDTGVAAQALLNAPRQVTYMLVSPERQVIAFGCNEEVSGAFNPLCIRGSDIEGPTTWNVTTANNAFEHVLESGGRIVGARVTGYGIFVWTTDALYQGTFLGDPAQTYRFDLLGRNAGLLGPNAAVIAGQTAYWIGPDLQFRACALGGAPVILSSPLQAEFADRLANSQYDKVVAATISQFGEVWWFYPDNRDGYENSRYISLAYLGDPAWSQGILARTAFIDASPTESPMGVDYAGAIYYHERGSTADGAPLSTSIETGDYYFGDGDRTMQIEGMWPDFQDQMGVVSLELVGRLYPQATERSIGPYSLVPGRSKKDFRISARVLRVRFSSNSAPSYYRFGKMEFDAYERGIR